MTTEPKRRTLGRGLSALLGDSAEDYAQLDRLRSVRTVAVDQLRPSPYQPRRRMDEDDLRDLAHSITEKGVLQPILVRRTSGDDGGFEIIAGERRWRAAQMAQLHEVPVVIRELSDREALEIALIENLQRQDLTAIEEAEGYRRLMEEFAHTQEALAQSIGKSRSHVANTLRLLSLPPAVKTLLDQGELTAGHARALIGADDPESLAKVVLKRGLNVRQTEHLASARRSNADGKPRSPKDLAKDLAKDPGTRTLEADLSALLGLKVEIRFRGSGGTLVLHYKTLDQLDDILRRLRQEAAGGPAPSG